MVIRKLLICSGNLPQGSIGSEFCLPSLYFINSHCFIIDIQVCFSGEMVIRFMVNINTKNAWEVSVHGWVFILTCTWTLLIFFLAY